MLEQLRIGQTEARVFPIGFGGLPLSLASRPPEKEGIEVIHAALDAGINFIDTANVYCIDDDDIGHNERLIRKALAQWPKKDKIWVATKCGFTRPRGQWVAKGHPKHLRQACEDSLKALGVDRIFLLQLHAPDDNVPIQESVGALLALQQEGKIAHIGLSNVRVEDIKLAETVATIQTVQNRFHVFCQRDLYNGVVDYCAERGMSYIAYSPMGGYARHRDLVTHHLIQNLAEVHGVSAYQIMLAWALSKNRCILPIPAASHVKNVLSSAAALRVKLSEGDIQRLDQIELVA